MKTDASQAYEGLLRRQFFIDGTWLGDIAGGFAVTDPATGETFSTVANATASDAESAIEAATNALPDWRGRPAAERADILYGWYELILQHKDSLALLMTREQGKPISEAEGEIDYGASFVRWYAEEAVRVYGDTIPGPTANRRILVVKEPVGVVAAITPWNFPVAMITRKVAPALAAGCTVIVKPSEETPLCALALAELAHRAGLPPGTLNVLTTTHVQVVGEVLTSSSDVRKLSFTGSTKVGKQLMRQCAGTLKKLSLELGGNAPFIVFADADISAAVAGAMTSKYRNAGQTCICANRFYVQADVYDEFCRKLSDAVDALQVGNGRSRGTDIGPLINRKAFEKVDRLVREAVEEGAVSNTPIPSPDEMPDNFYPPLVLTDVPPDAAILSEEIFGPVAPVVRFTEDAEVIEQANATPAGLAAYFYGKEHGRIWRVAEALRYGMIGVNTGSISNASAPFGGVKESGFGREGGRYGIEEYLVTKYISWQIAPE